LAASNQSANDPSNSTWQSNLGLGHVKIGDTQRTRGNLREAQRSYEAALAITEKLALADPRNTQWKLDRAIRHDRIGVAQREQGDRTSALRSFQAATDIRGELQALAPRTDAWQRDFHVRYERSDDKGHESLFGVLQRFSVIVSQMNTGLSKPDDLQSQRELCTSYDSMAIMALQNGNFTSALDDAQKSLAIRQKHVDADPNNRQLKSDLSFSHDQIGEAQSGQANPTASLQSHQTAIEIRRELAAADSNNAQWQFDFAATAWKIGTLKGAPKTKAEQLAVLAEGLKVMDDLAQRQLLAPTQAGWPGKFRKAIAELQ